MPTRQARIGCCRGSGYAVVAAMLVMISVRLTATRMTGRTRCVTVAVSVRMAIALGSKPNQCIDRFITL